MGSGSRDGSLVESQDLTFPDGGGRREAKLVACKTALAKEISLVHDGDDRLFAAFGYDR